MIEKLGRMLGERSNLYPHKTEAKYPRIVERIAILWGTIGMSKYFTEILFDDRGDREGFPPDVMQELFALSNFHETNKPSRAALESAWKSSEVDRMSRFNGKD